MTILDSEKNAFSGVAPYTLPYTLELSLIKDLVRTSISLTASMNLVPTEM
jgi:hypothetical protein